MPSVALQYSFRVTLFVSSCSPAQPHRQTGGLQRPGSGPGPDSAAQDHGAGRQPTGKKTHTHNPFFCFWALMRPMMFLFLISFCSENCNISLCSIIKSASKCLFVRVCAFACGCAVLMGPDAGRIQTQEHQDQRGSVPLSHHNAQHVRIGRRAH